jgi:hypothetical protein
MQIRLLISNWPAKRPALGTPSGRSRERHIADLTCSRSGPSGEQAARRLTPITQTGSITGVKLQMKRLRWPTSLQRGHLRKSGVVATASISVVCCPTWMSRRTSMTGTSSGTFEKTVRMCSTSDRVIPYRWVRSAPLLDVALVGLTERT